MGTMRWLTIPRDKAHALMLTNGNEYEFWCGKGRLKQEVRLAIERDKKCPDCLEYIKNSRKVQI